MSCCCSSVGAAAERQFSEKRATKDLAKYRSKGPGPTARLLLAGIAKAGPPHGRLLDVGSGVGVLMFELLERGLTEAIGIDLSSAYVSAASDEAARRGRTDAVRFVHGDFVGIASQFLAAAIVTLDRVICCYPEYERLLDESVRHAGHHFALSYPRDVWYVRTSFANPAVTVARALTNTFAGIRPADAPGFIAAQLVGAGIATLFFRWLAPALSTEAKDVVVPRRQNLRTS